MGDDRDDRRAPVSIREFARTVTQATVDKYGRMLADPDLTEVDRTTIALIGQLHRAGRTLEAFMLIEATALVGHAITTGSDLALADAAFSVATIMTQAIGSLGRGVPYTPMFPTGERP